MSSQVLGDKGCKENSYQQLSCYSISPVLYYHLAVLFHVSATFEGQGLSLTVTRINRDLEGVVRLEMASGSPQGYQSSASS